MTERLEKGALSRDVQLMYLGDVNAAPTIQNGQVLAFDETTEKFIPANFIVLYDTALAAYYKVTLTNGTLVMSAV